MSRGRTVSSTFHHQALRPSSTRTHKAFLARIVEDGPIPAIHGVVRWRACDLIMQLHEEFALSVSDDTIYRALKDLGFSHVSARPKAYKQDTEAMQLHLDEIATKVTPGALAILILDQAGWHGAKTLKVPRNISLLPLPPRSPELNPQENIWQYMRQNWLSNRVFKSFDDIVDHCCFAWNTLIDQPWKIMSIARRDWVIAGQSWMGIRHGNAEILRRKAERFPCTPRSHKGHCATFSNTKPK